MREIPIDMTRFIPVVDIKLWSRTLKMYQTASLVLDTGAAVTTLSKDIFDFLGYNVASGGKKRVTTASGIEYMNDVTLDKIMFAGFELTNITAYAHVFPQNSFIDGVIGINILSNFDMFISLQNKILKLIPVQM